MRYGTKSDWAHGAHDQAVRLVGSGKRVLDVGCSSGELASMLKANGCTVVGIEYDAEAAAKAGEHCTLVLNGDLETMELSFKEREFDHILFMDVLDHLRDPESLLVRMRQFLKDDGNAIISIPNVANMSIRARLLIGQWNYTEYGIMDKTHLRFYTRKTALAMVERAGYDIESVGVTPGVPLISKAYRKPVLSLNYALSKTFQTAFATQFLISARRTRPK